MFFACLLKHYDKGCMVVTEVRKKCSIFPKYVCCISAIYKGCRSMLIDNIGKGYFLTGHSEKGHQFQNIERTV